MKRISEVIDKLCEMCANSGYSPFPMEIAKTDVGYKVTTAHNQIESRSYSIEIDEEGNEVDEEIAPEAGADWET